MAKSAFPETHELHFGWPGMHGPKWSNLAMNTLRRARLRRSALRRPRDRQARRLRARRHRRPPRHRRGRDRQAAPRGRAGRRAAQADPGRPRRRGAPSCARPAATPDTEPWLRRLEDWREEFPLRYGNGGAAEAADGARDAPGADRRPRRRDLDDGRRPAPDVGDAVPALRPAAHLHHLGRARHDGLRRSRRRSARRRRGRTRPSSASTATAASR